MGVDLTALPRNRGGFDGFTVTLAGTERPADAGAVARLLTGLGPCTGWLCTTGRLLVLEQPAVPVPGGEAPLSAELLIGDGTAVHLRHRGDGGWTVTRLVRTDDAAGLGRRQTYLVSGGRPLRAVYEVAWSVTTDAAGLQVLRPALSRFAGFEPAEEV